MENKNLAPHEPVVREGDPTPSNATAEPSAAQDLRYGTPDATFITAALSWYDGGPASDDVQQAWDRILAERAELLAALKLAADWMGEPNRRPSVMEAITAAIAKATGANQ